MQQIIEKIDRATKHALEKTIFEICVRFSTLTSENAQNWLNFSHYLKKSLS